MESKIKSSFIPDKMPGAGGPSSVRARSSGGAGADIFVVISIVIFAASIALAAGVFLYDKYVTASAKAKSEQLKRERKLLDPATIKDLMRFDNRLNAANKVLVNHIAPSELFKLLERITLKSVYFKNLEYTIGKNGDITINMKGKARSVNGVALQSDIFGKNRVVINPIFSNLDLVADGVEFSVSATIDRRALLYTSVSAYSDDTDGQNYYNNESDF